MKTITEEVSKEIALTVSVIIREDILNGTVNQTFDKAYEIAKEFVIIYPINTDWEQVRELEDLEWDEVVVKFTNKLINK